MPSQQLKALIRRLFEDETHLRAFLTTPERVLDGASIVPEERRAVMRLHGTLVASTGGGVGSARFDTLIWP
jgi:hypothetical protein